MPAKAKAAPVVPPLFRAALKAAGLPMPEAEVRFHPTRKWRFDYAWPDRVQYIEPVWDDDAEKYRWESLRPAMLALEVEGGVWVQGRHTRGSGFLKDVEKYNEAAALGWRILRVTPSRLCHPDTIDLIGRALAQ